MHERLIQAVSEAFPPARPKRIGVAVSGGGDSMALLHLLHQFCANEAIALHAVTVDHGLRPEAADEAESVSRHCAALGIPHETLRWEQWNGSGNLQHAARVARYERIADWAHSRAIETVALGHTADDQAETFLMRLSRRSGVDGLSGMAERRLWNGVNWVRPLLFLRREELRAYLRTLDVDWIDDPSNDDLQFDRIKARRALKLLAGLGVDADVLGEVTAHLRDARKALEWQTFLAAKQCFSVEAGAAVLDETCLRLQPDEIQRRLIIMALKWISGSDYAPRRDAVARLLAALKQGQAETLEGCQIRRISDQIWIFRELQAVRGKACDTRELWDNRWRMVPTGGAEHSGDLVVRPLSQEGLQLCPEWRATKRPYVVLQSTPAIWRGDTLVAAPLAGLGPEWRAELAGGPETLFAAVLSH